MLEPAALRAWVIIPARAGSKGIPAKNLQKVQGRSLIARAVAAAKSAIRIERVFVSTDDPAIAAEARRTGSEVVDRPQEISGDAASSEEALLHALDFLEQSGEDLPDIVVLVQCTSPFIRAADIDGTVACLLDVSVDTAHTVSRSHGFLWRRAAGSGAEGVNHDSSSRLRRQDRDPEFLETGAAYAMRLKRFRIEKHRFFGKTALYETPQSRAMEIDEPDDLRIARALAPTLEKAVRHAAVPSRPSAIFFDFDGVMTDDLVHLDQHGNEAVTCSRSDGLGIEMLRTAGIRMAVISKERNTVVAARCHKLLLAYQHGIDDKAGMLRTLAAEMRVDLRQAIYVGNDVTDLECMRIVGFSVAVADAHPRARAEAAMVLSSPGGHGAVRELAELILARDPESRTSG